MNIFEAQENSYFANEENKQESLHYPNDFLLESVAFRLHLEEYERLYDDDITNYKDAYNDAKDDFVTGGYFNFVNSVYNEECNCDIQRLFLYKNGAVGAEGIQQLETENGIEEVEIKLVIELY